MDFPTYFLMLREAPSAFSGFLEIHQVRGVEGDGRFLPGFALITVVKWSVLGENLAAWQLWRFAEMSAIAVLSFVLARRLGATRTGAVVAAITMSFANGAASSYVKLQIAEPPGTLLVLLAALTAASYQTTARPRWTAALMTVLLGLALWMRETFIGCVPFVILLALSWSGKQFIVPRPSRRNLELVGIALLGVGLAAAPIVMVRRATVGTGAYSANYGLSVVTPSNISNVVRGIILPVTRVVFFPANAAFLGVLLAGWFLALFRGNGRSEVTRLFVLLVLPLSGMAVFAPWPFFNGYYAFPFTLGSSLLLAAAVTTIQHRAGRGALVAALLACLLIPAYGSIEAIRARRRMWAQSLVDDEVVRYLASTARDAVAVGAVPNTDPKREFDSINLRLSAQLITGDSLPAGDDISCVEAARQLRTGLSPDVLVVYAHLCPHVAPTGIHPSKTVRRIFQFRSWKNLASVVDSVRADIWRRDSTAVSATSMRSR
jgi:hypothetical protein